MAEGRKLVKVMREFMNNTFDPETEEEHEGFLHYMLGEEHIRELAIFKIKKGDSTSLYDPVDRSSRASIAEYFISHLSEDILGMNLEMVAIDWEKRPNKMTPIIVMGDF